MTGDFVEVFEREIPKPEQFRSQGRDLAEVCTQVDRWISAESEPWVIKRWSDELAALVTYVRRRGEAGAKAAESTLRRMEIRIAELTPKQQGTRTDLATSPGVGRSSPPLPKNQMSEARKMAEHPDIVERVIEESTDADPPTKAKVIREINAATFAPPEQYKQPAPRRRPLPDQLMTAGWDLRKTIERLDRLAEDDRFRTHKSQVAPQMRSHFDYAIEALNRLRTLMEDPNE